jgi:hypothetical protein
MGPLASSIGLGLFGWLNVQPGLCQGTRAISKSGSVSVLKERPGVCLPGKSSRVSGRDNCRFFLQCLLFLTIFPILQLPVAS